MVHGRTGTYSLKYSFKGSDRGVGVKSLYMETKQMTCNFFLE